jgi:hypothetical protein
MEGGVSSGPLGAPATGFASPPSRLMTVSV